MPRNMSFSMTTEQFKTQTKTVTRRFGWRLLKPGDLVMGVEKAMGLKKGEKAKQLCLIRIVSTRLEPLDAITPDGVVREGFPGWTAERFVEMMVKHYRVKPDTEINRIEFEYI